MMTIMMMLELKWWRLCVNWVKAVVQRNSTVAVALFLWLIVVAPKATTASSPSSSLPGPPQEERPPNIVFLVCESTDGRTWRRGYQNDVIPLPNLRYLEEQPGGYSFHRHYSNAPVCCTSRATFWSGRQAHKIPHVQRQEEPASTRQATTRLSTSTTTTTTTTKEEPQQTQETKKRDKQRRVRELNVHGVWNNYEGLPHDFVDRFDQVLQRSQHQYATYLSGKRDWTTGGHSDSVKLSAWTMYARFPYNIHEHGGWIAEPSFVCGGENGTVVKSSNSEITPHHVDDWNTLNQTLAWMLDYQKAKNNGTIDKDKPFFVYQGMNIVHPPYVTNQYWYDKIDPSKIEIPTWLPLEELHPCDLQSSMMKGCIPPLDNRTAYEFYYDKYRRRNIRRIYYAMIAEFDAMVGKYMKAIKDMGVWNNTIFVVTSDHGDLQMEHQQSYKMVPYDASSSVPLIIMDGRVQRKEKRKGESTPDNHTNYSRRIVTSPTQLLDIYPTMMDLAGVPLNEYPHDKLDGHSLVPLMREETISSQEQENLLPLVNTTKRPDFVVSQFHGMDIAMSWFLIVKIMPCVKYVKSKKYHHKNDDNNSRCAYKLVIWGTGREVDSQLFDLSSDPGEMINLIHRADYQSTFKRMKQDLRSVVDYPKVALDVASYNKMSMKNWIDVVGNPEWRDVIHREQLYWHATWEHDSTGAFRALEEWINSTKVEILPCRGDLVWPPPTLVAQEKSTTQI